MAVEGIGYIQDIGIENIKKENKEVSSMEEISNTELLKSINSGIEGLWDNFFQAENKNKLKKINFNNDSWKTETEELFDTWLKSNPNIIEKIKFEAFVDKKIDKQKQDELKKYLTVESLNLNKEKVKNELQILKKELNMVYEILSSDTSPDSMKAKFEKLGPIYFDDNSKELDYVSFDEYYEDKENKEKKEKLTFKKFTENIHGVVDAYFSDLDFIEPKVLESMNVGVQFALMDILKDTKNTDFFDVFNTTSSSSKKGVLLGLLQSFTKGKGYLDLGIKLENLKNHLKENKIKYGNCDKCVDLSNPVNFMNTLKNKSFVNKKNIKLKQGDGVDFSQEQQKKLQKIASKIDLDKDKVLKINTSTQKAQEILGKRVEWKSGISGLYSDIQEATDEFIQGELMQSVKGVFGTNKNGTSRYLIDILGENDSFIRKVVDFFLGLLGFSGGLEGVHKDYIRENIDKGLKMQPERKLFVTGALKYYQDSKNEEKYLEKETTFDKFPDLKAQKENDDQKKGNTLKITDKIPSNYALLSTAIKESIEKNPASVLNVNVLERAGLEQRIDEENKIKTVKKIGTGELDDFVDTYLQYAIPELIKNNKFMKAISSPDDFAFALFGNLTLDHFFVEGVKISIVDKKSYGGIERKNPQNNISKIPEYIEGQNLILIDKVIDNKEAFQKKVIAISKELGVNPNALMAVMNKESGLNPESQNNNTKAIGLIQFMPNTLSGMNPSYTVDQVKIMSNLQQLELVKSFYLSNKGKLSNIKSLYLATFFPIALDHQDEPNWVFQSRKLTDKKIASNNPGIDMDKDGKITMEDFNNYINKKVIPNALAI